MFIPLSQVRETYASPNITIVKDNRQSSYFDDATVIGWVILDEHTSCQLFHLYNQTNQANHDGQETGQPVMGIFTNKRLTGDVAQTGVKQLLKELELQHTEFLATHYPQYQ